MAEDFPKREAEASLLVTAEARLRDVFHKLFSEVLRVPEATPPPSNAAEQLDTARQRATSSQDSFARLSECSDLGSK